MSSLVGIVCGNCDWFNPRDGRTCERCGHDLTLSFPSIDLGVGAEGGEVEEPSAGVVEIDPSQAPPPEVIEPGEMATDGVPELITSSPDEDLVAAAAKEGVLLRPSVSIGLSVVEEQRRAKERQMEQARHYVCKSCYSPVPGGHKFCGKCGAPTNFGEDHGVVQYFGAMQVPNKAKLILIKGEGLDGISYHLNSTEHVAGRQQGAILFPDDSWLSPRHANFYYRDNKLFVRDEDSLNGVYVRIREPTPLRPGSMFLCGEQVFRLENADPLDEGPEEDGTYFYASPVKAWSFRVVQVLRGGINGMIVHDEGGTVTIGREDSMMNFLDDPYISPQHAKVTLDGGQFVLTDLDSQNGTFVRIEQEKELVHGDYLFLGKQLLRVEITP